VHEMTLLGLGSDVSAKELIVTGLGLTALAVCVGKARFALFLIIPTILIAGAANLIAWFTGAEEEPRSGQQTATDLPKGQASVSSGGSHDHSMWSGWLFGLTVLLAVALIGLLLVTAVVRSRQENLVRDALGEFDDASLDEPPDASTPYPDEPSPGSGRAVGYRPSERDDADHAHSIRMNVLAYDFLSHVCERDDRPALIDINAPLTQRFLCAFTDATDLFLTEGARDPRLKAAIREAERRWTQVKLRMGGGRGDEQDGFYGRDHG